MLLAPSYPAWNRNIYLGGALPRRRGIGAMTLRRALAALNQIGAGGNELNYSLPTLIVANQLRASAGEIPGDFPDIPV